MFRMCLGEDSENLSTGEQVAIEGLIAARWRLLMDGDRINTKTEDGSSACATYLEAVDIAANTLRLEKASRTYRESFTINYRALFPDLSRNYRVDVLEAGFEQYATIWVNGDKFEFSAEAMRRAEALQRTWWELGLVLEGWNQTPQASQAGPRPPSRSELRTALVALDFAWASFEHKYITELIEIEEKARQLIVRAIEHERSVALMEKHFDPQKATSAQRLEETSYWASHRQLVFSIGHLNSVANVRRKGRDDLVVQVLQDAVSTLKRCDSSEKRGENTEKLIAARILATDVVDSYQAMRHYLKEVEHCLERVDPHLCNNSGLVARLADWEESWEMGARYMQDEQLLNAVCDLVASIRRAQTVVPALTAMCEECDVELFLVLPRMIWLRFLMDPMSHTRLLQSLLPHHFKQERQVVHNTSKTPIVVDVIQSTTWDSKLDAFLGKFRHTQQCLASCLSWKGPDAKPEEVLWEVLVKRVVGVGTTGPSVALNAETESSVDDLIRSMEPWSIELQRHCPEDWNQCSAILVQCLTRASDKPKPTAFQV